jgi:hypothetical protein
LLQVCPERANVPPPNRNGSISGQHSRQTLVLCRLLPPYSPWGSLGKNGDSMAEQNHSSVVAYLGDGGNFSTAEQVKALLERHQDRARTKTKEEQNLMVSIDRYKSPLPHGYQATEDLKAKKALSAHAHKHFFLKSLKRGERLRHDFTP